MGNSSENWVCVVGKANGGTCRGIADCDTRDTGGGGACEILSNAVKELTGQLQLLDESRGKLVQDVTGISERIPHLDDFSRYRKRIRALENEVDRICGQLQLVEHLEQSVHDLSVGLDNVSNQQRVSHRNSAVCIAEDAPILCSWQFFLDFLQFRLLSTKKENMQHPNERRRLPAVGGIDEGD
eukprot:EG_transcript_23127